MGLDSQKVGHFIQQERLKKKLKQKQFADLLHVSPAAVSKWEKGVNTPDTENLIEISKILDISVSEILNGEFDDAKKESDQEPGVLMADTKDPDSIPEISKTDESTLTSDSSPPPRVKKRLHKKVIALSISLFLLVGCIGLIALYCYYAPPVFKMVDEYYGPLETLEYDNVHYVVFKYNKKEIKPDEYFQHWKFLVTQYDLSSFEECNAIVFMYFEDYDAETDSIETSTHYNVLFPLLYEIDLPLEDIKF